MPAYTIIVITKEEETIASLSEAISDSVFDFPSRDRIDPDYLVIDGSREAKYEDAFHVSFQRVE